jgi:hypothetical protein
MAGWQTVLNRSEHCRLQRSTLSATVFYIVCYSALPCFNGFFLPEPGMTRHTGSSPLHSIVATNKYCTVQHGMAPSLPTTRTSAFGRIKRRRTRQGKGRVRIKYHSTVLQCEQRPTSSVPLYIETKNY